MNELAHPSRRSFFRWLWWFVYIISPTAVGVPLLALVGDGRMFAWGGNMFMFGCILAILPLGWIFFVTILLSVKWRDFVFLVWGSPLALVLLYWTFIKADSLNLFGSHGLAVCAGIPFELIFLFLYAATLLFSFVVGIVGSVVCACAWLRSRVQPSE